MIQFLIRTSVNNYQLLDKNQIKNATPFVFNFFDIYLIKREEKVKRSLIDQMLKKKIDNSFSEHTFKLIALSTFNLKIKKLITLYIALLHFCFFID